MNYKIGIDNLSFSYKKDIVIKDVSLKIAANDVVGILGHNGAGKTTLFRLMLGILKPKNGTIIFGQDKGKRNVLSFLPDNNGLYGKLTAYENLMFRSKIYNLNLPNTNEVINATLRDFNLHDQMCKQVRMLSNGQKKRVALAATIMIDSDIIVLDEPTTGIDPESMKILGDQILKLRSTGRTILISSHDLDFISKIASKVIILQNGKVVYDNTLDTANDSLNQIYLRHTLDTAISD